MMIKSRFAYCRIFFWLLLAFVLLVGSGSAVAQTTAFTYQGRLANAGNPANGNYDLQFELYDALTGGAQIGATFNNPSVLVANGIFTVQLDFGAAAFDGTARFLEIGVRPTGSPIAFTILAPRLPIMPTPYAIRATESAAADGLTAACVNCVTSGQIQNVDGSQVTGEIPVASVPTGSGNYIQNATTAGARKSAPQPAASFNIDGDGVIGGNLGIGTGAAPTTTKLQVNGEMAIESPVPVIHTAAGGDEQNRFLHLVNSPTFRSAAGLKAGGVLVADNYGFADPGKNHLVVKGNIGIGTNVVDSSPKLVIYGQQNALEISGHEPFLTMLDSSEPGAIHPTLFRFQAINGFFGFNQIPACSTSPCSPIRTPMAIDPDGNVGIGIVDPTAKLHVIGTAKTGVLEITGGSDLAEHFEIAEEAKSGLVVAIDPKRAGKLTLARGAYNRRVAGIISGAKNLSPGMVLPDIVSSEKSLPVALSGRVWVYCDASANPITPGDLLTTSNVPGHAMKAANYRRAQGAIIGKAMTGLKSGRGLVLVLVTLQ